MISSKDLSILIRFMFVYLKTLMFFSQTAITLATLFDETGCRTQICTSLDIFVPVIREEADWQDDILFQMAKLECYKDYSPESEVRNIFQTLIDWKNISFPCRNS